IRLAWSCRHGRGELFGVHDRAIHDAAVLAEPEAPLAFAVFGRLAVEPRKVVAGRKDAGGCGGDEGIEANGIHTAARESLYYGRACLRTCFDGLSAAWSSPNLSG